MRLLPGSAARRRQTATYLTEWLADNELALGADGPLWVVLGDSTGQGVGTSIRQRGYVGRVLGVLGEGGHVPWRVVNLSRSGARVRDVVADQLPRVDGLAPDLVSAAVGANDLLRTPLRRLGDDLATLASRLPPGALLANLPQGLGHRRASVVNRLIAELVDRHALVLVDLWDHTGPPWEGRFSADGFHPNDVGYEAWASAFLEALARGPGPSPRRGRRPGAR